MVKSDVTQNWAVMLRKIVGERRKILKAGSLRSNINLNKGFPFVRQFAAYSPQI
jgi:hypothetical protein